MKSQLDVSSPTEHAACRPDALLSEQLDLARSAFQQFLGKVALALPEYLSVPVDVSSVGAAQLPLSEALGEVDAGDCVAPMSLSAVRGVAHLVLDRQFVGAALEILLGAPADAAEIPRASLTAVDLHVLHELIVLLATEVQAAWEPISGSSFTPLSSAAGDSGAGGQIDSHSVLRLTADVVLNGAAGRLQLLVPSILIRQAFARKRAANDSAPASREALFDAVCSASFRLEAVLHGSHIRIRDLLALKAGQTLALPLRTDAAIECQVNGSVKYRGELVQNGESVGFQIVSEV